MNTVIQEKLGRIEKKLDRIARLLEQMPQVMAATYLLMKQEVDEASLRGMKASDLFEINPGKEKNQSGA